MSSKLQQDTTLPTRLSKIKRPVSPNAGKDGGAGYQNMHVLLAGMQNDAAGKVWLAGRLFMKLSIHLPHTKPAVPPLGVYQRNKSHIHKRHVHEGSQLPYSLTAPNWQRGVAGLLFYDILGKANLKGPKADRSLQGVRCGGSGMGLREHFWKCWEGSVSGLWWRLWDCV